jgi:hypothetical protein
MEARTLPRTPELSSCAEVVAPESTLSPPGRPHQALAMGRRVL